MPDSISHAQLMRFNRQIVLPQVDIDGQEALLAASVLVIGCGGLGCNALQQLAAAGVGQLTLVDDDTVSAHNLPRQILFSDADVGARKVDAAQQALARLAPHCEITKVAQRLAEDDLIRAIGKHDVVLDCTDSLASRLQLNRACARAGVALVSGAAIRFEGQLFVTDYSAGQPCYSCVSQLFAEPAQSCTETGIFGPVVATIGVQQAQLAIQCLIGFGRLPLGTLMLYDGLSAQWQHFTVPRHPSCSVCQPD